jgi:hypothetical protein
LHPIGYSVFSLQANYEVAAIQISLDVGAGPSAAPISRARSGILTRRRLSKFEIRGAVLRSLLAIRAPNPRVAAGARNYKYAPTVVALHFPFVCCNCGHARIVAPILRRK